MSFEGTWQGAAIRPLPNSDRSSLVDRSHNSDQRLQIGNLLTTTNGTVQAEPPRIYRCSDNGRAYYVYQGDVVYPFPVDEEEKRRLDQFHHLIHTVALNKKLFTADLRVRGCRPRILDVGHGTGIWALDMGGKFPGCDIYGIDLIDNQDLPPEPAPNVTFYNGIDFTSSDWNMSESSFDLIRMSQLCGSVGDWLHQYQTAHKYLKPATGWIEHIEVDWKPRYTIRNGLPQELEILDEWWRRMQQASSIVGRPIDYRDDTEALLENAGFADISHRTIRISLQANPKDERESNLKRCFKSFTCMQDDDDGGIPQLFESLSLSLLTRRLYMNSSDVRAMCEAIRTIYRSDRWPLYHAIHIWTARKPMS